MIFLARLQVLKWHRATYHTHTQYVLKQDLHYPYYPLVLLHKELESQSWSRLHRWVAPKKIFRVPLPKTQRLFAKHLELTFFTFVYLPMFGSKTWTKFWNSRLCGYGTDTSIHWWLFRRCSCAAERVESWLDKDIWRLKVVWRCITYTKDVGCGSDTVMRRDAVRWAWTAGSFRLWVRGIWLLRSSRTNPTTFSSKLLWLSTYNMYTLEVQDHQNNSPQFWMIKFPTKKIVLRENPLFLNGLWTSRVYIWYIT